MANVKPPAPKFSDAKMAVPFLGEARLGQVISSLLPKSAKLISMSPDGGSPFDDSTRSEIRRYDLGTDKRPDLEWRDIYVRATNALAGHAVVVPNGLGAVFTVTSSKPQGKVDGLKQTSGTSFWELIDANGDGRVDREVFVGAGSHRILVDQDFDGIVDDEPKPTGG